MRPNLVLLAALLIVSAGILVAGCTSPGGDGIQPTETPTMTETETTPTTMETDVTPTTIETETIPTTMETDTTPIAIET
ncbi:hypothetical protein [Methanoculleus sp.]|uniref:hypothetical protein n=1 Tax=Methanoculleus sp. TaxID=90427 RepID=UPI0025FFFF0B|nr:hypothetical protein [Methanoculleus sp.]